MVVGLLALQGAFAAHRAVFDRLGTDCVEVRRPSELDGCDALVIPGGESTTITKLLDGAGLRQPLTDAIAGGLPVLGTCAGAICLSAEVLDGRPDQLPLGSIDMTVRRNGYGRQVDSFECDVVAPTLGDTPLPIVAIRAPRIVRTGDDVEVIAELDGDPLIVRQGSALATTFHPELSGDDRVHQLFLSVC